MPKMNKMKMGRLVIDLGYVVDMNNADMVEEAKLMFLEDIMSAQRYNELISWIKVIEDKNAKKSDIPDSLKEVMDL